jgi:putative DNA primase/helicase
MRSSLTNRPSSNQFDSRFCDLDAEKHLLGVALFDQGYANHLADLNIAPFEFSTEGIQKAWHKIENMHANGEEIHTNAVGAKLKLDPGWDFNIAEDITLVSSAIARDCRERLMACYRRRDMRENMRKTESGEMSVPELKSQLERLERAGDAKMSGGYLDNDAGRASRFCDRWSNEILFIPERGIWMTWEGRWKRDIAGGLKRRAVSMASEIMQEVAARPATTKDELRQRATEVAGAVRWGDERTIKPMLALAEAVQKVQCSASEIDADPWLLGTPNAIVDLRTGQAKPHYPEARITLSTLAEYDPKATAPRWECFLEEVFPDAELRRFVWKAAGYSVTGDMGEECFFMLHNSGRNGKSKFIGAIEHALGDYADTAGAGLVVANDRGEDPKREKAAILGIRFLRAPETEGKQKLNIRAIKDITGGDSINAEAKYENPFSFKPTCKIWWACNDRPAVNEIGPAIWERVRMIPFERYFKPEDRDLELESKLKSEASGILNWLIAGAILWQSEGMRVLPAKVKDAVAEYQRDEDTLADFIEEATEQDLDPNSTVAHADLFHRYEDWARDSGVRFPLAKVMLSKQLRKKGWISIPSAQSKTNWRGISLLP